MDRSQGQSDSGCAIPSFFALIILFIMLYFVGQILLSQTYFLWHGIKTQAVITDEEAISCGRASGYNITVQFTDGISTFNNCTYGLIIGNPPPGSLITIVYNPDHPAMIAPRDGLIGTVLGLLFLIILCGAFLCFAIYGLIIGVVGFFHEIKRLSS